ncbi:glycoside hydrolase family 35 protein [Diplogelasinospora grovesii]|uniref:Beta-galactosidase n=1 Tax=Diplogelasinospora grovesii TaxID=303347 RepID=A0AAN6MYS4_9PEZI|nr:glycoside hydrolase family 35 protein [Diplogelasinospora grovesii]
MIIRGERMYIFSGEFHPFRLPSPGLWLDIFQKIKSLGFNAVSFYTYWGLVEGEPGSVQFDGVFALTGFFSAAAEAGIYLIARPGPYINAEVASGGFPGWTLRIQSPLRGNGTDFLQSINAYSTAVGKLIADAQITNGGPVVMVQVENEYDTWPGVNNSDFPAPLNRQAMAYTQKLFRDAGIVVPFMHNDHLNQGNWAPGSGLGAVDLYGIDAYPLRYDCAHPDVWPTYRFPTDWQKTHEQWSPNTPFFVAEFQGGSATGFGTSGQDGCAALVNMEAVRVLWKNNYGFGMKMFNVYMTYGGTNWGNLGYMGGDTSYDYGAAIKENRHVWREKYSEEKLQANFFKVSPAFLTAVAGNAANGSTLVGGNKDIAITPVLGTEDKTNFYIVRHADFTSLNNTQYKLQLPTSKGNLTIPQLDGKLTLFGRDSKIHVTDYDVGGIHMIYSTAEIFTWQRDRAGKRTLVLYGGEGEPHEFAFDIPSNTSVQHRSTVKSQQLSSLLVVQWSVTRSRQIVKVGTDLEVLLLWRNEAYNYWVLELPSSNPLIGNYSSPSKESVIIKAGYLLRTASIPKCSGGKVLKLTGDINATTDVEIIHEPTGNVTSLLFNNRPQPLTASSDGYLSTTIHFDPPRLDPPDFRSLTWSFINSLPEVNNGYDDSRWTASDHPNTTNPEPLRTPTTLYASDYGYHSGSLLYRGHFTSDGSETGIFLNTSGGSGYGYSVFLNSTHLRSWDGGPPAQRNRSFAETIPFPPPLSSRPIPLRAGEEYVVTVLMDHMGQDEEAPGTDAIKAPMGILDFSLLSQNTSRNKTNMLWKMTGNLGGEQYVDKTRGPRNEGALFAERQGYHLPNPPTTNPGWSQRNPIGDGVDGVTVGLFTTTFELNIPQGYDVPLSFVFHNNTAKGRENSRAQLFVNGWQFGKYVANLGPQTTFPVPEGILNHNGVNTVAITLWSFSENGAKLPGLSLEAEMPLLSGYRKPDLVPMDGWIQRAAY